MIDPKQVEQRGKFYYCSKDNPRKKFCSGECERKWDRLRAAGKRAGVEGV